MSEKQEKTEHPSFEQAIGSSAPHWLLQEGARIVRERLSYAIRTHPPVPNMREDCVDHLVAGYAALICAMPDWARVEFAAYRNCMGYDDE